MTIAIEGIKDWREGIGWAQFSKITVSANYVLATKEPLTQDHRDALMVKMSGLSSNDIRHFECETLHDGDVLVLDRSKDWLKRFGISTEYADANAGGAGTYIVLVRYGWDDRR